MSGLELKNGNINSNIQSKLAMQRLSSVVFFSISSFYLSFTQCLKIWKKSKKVKKNCLEKIGWIVECKVFWLIPSLNLSCVWHLKFLYCNPNRFDTLTMSLDISIFQHWSDWQTEKKKHELKTINCEINQSFISNQRLPIQSKSKSPLFLFHFILFSFV